MKINRFVIKYEQLKENIKIKEQELNKCKDIKERVLIKEELNKLYDEYDSTINIFKQKEDNKK